MCVCVGGGATLIFSDHSFGFKILNFNLFGGFSRKLIFRVVCWNCGFSLRGGGLGVITKLDYVECSF